MRLNQEYRLDMLSSEPACTMISDHITQLLLAQLKPHRFL